MEMAQFETAASLLQGPDTRYAPAVEWRAPRRGIRWLGREEVVRNLRREWQAMSQAAYTSLRSSGDGAQLFEEFAVRFVYRGIGIEQVPFRRGQHVELLRLRILTLETGLVVQETCIETWTLLRPG